MQWNRKYRTLADLVFPLQDLWALVRLRCRMLAALVFLQLVLLALACLVQCLLVFRLLVVCRLLASQLRKAMVAMALVETAPSSALEYMAACGT